jgi:hypothetical protein
MTRLIALARIYTTPKLPQKLPNTAIVFVKGHFLFTFESSEPAAVNNADDDDDDDGEDFVVSPPVAPPRRDRTRDNETCLGRKLLLRLLVVTVSATVVEGR